MTDDPEIIERNILYELFIYAEWVQEPELVTKFGYGPEQGPHKQSYLSWFTSHPTQISSLLSFHVNSQIPWNISLTSDHRVVAVLRDNLVEIRSSKDDYANVVAQCAIPHDPQPQWRRVTWAPDFSFLVVSLSNGRLMVFDLAGSLMYLIREDELATLNSDLEYAQVGILFSEMKTKRTQWAYELISVSYGGHVRGYLVNSEAFSPSFTFQLPTIHGSLGAVLYHPKYDMILVGGSCTRNMEQADANDPSLVAGEAGITSWKMLQDHPYVEKVEMLRQDTSMGVISTLLSFLRSNCEDVVCHLSISPEGHQLLCIHTSGVVTLWSLPGLILLKLWRSYDLAGFKDTNPHLLEAEKAMQEKTVGLHNIIRADWWSEQAMVMVRKCGSICVISLESERNLLGEFPEWFSVSPTLAPMNAHGFLTLECEWQMGLSKARANSSFIGSELESSLLEDEEVTPEETTEAPSWFARNILFSPVRKILYYVTDRDAFDSDVKPRKVCKIYRLLGVKSTTPEELFAVKINNEEYEAALVLAQNYALDPDPVYQRQWRKNPVSKASIDAFLDKVHNRSWVLQECLQKVPTDSVSCRDLILYGLRATTVFAVNKIPQEDLNFADVHEEEAKRRRLLSQMDFDHLNLDQKWTCECRFKFLQYLDRLQIYETFSSTFEAKVFEQFRQMSPFEASVYFARRGNPDAVSAILTYFTSEVAPHWLVVLTQFPETMSANEYSKLLPYASSKPPYAIRQWQAHLLRTEVDWVEDKLPCSPFMEMWIAAEEEFYEDNPECVQWVAKDRLTMDLVAAWYLDRISRIESLTLLVENSLDLARLATQKQIKSPKLLQLHDDLLTVELLTFDCRREGVSLKSITEKSDYQKLQMVMENANEATFVNCFRNWLLPFVERCERSLPGSKFRLVSEYLSEVARNHLDRCVPIFELMSIDPSAEFIIEDLGNRLELCLHCSYASEKADHVECINRILSMDCIPRRTSSPTTKRLSGLYDEMDELESLLSCALCLSQYHADLTVSQVKALTQNQNEALLLIEKTSLRLCKKHLPPSQWLTFARDIIQMQKIVFTQLDLDQCFRRLCLALIGSANRDNIYTAGAMLTLDKPTALEDLPQFPHKLSKETSLEIVLKSAQDYLDSSTSYADQCISFAKSCLALIESIGGEEVKKELKLIEALPILHKLGLQMLPLHVRSHDKLGLIRQVLVCEKNNYKNYLQIERLARCLGVDEELLSQGVILDLVADMSIRQRDFKCAAYLCTKILASGYSHAWKSCARLGCNEEYRDFQNRRILLDFCIANAPGKHLDRLVKEKHNIALQEYYESLEQKFSKSEISLKTIPKDAVDTSKKILSSFARPDFWIETVKDTVKTLSTGPASLKIDDSPIKRASRSQRKTFAMLSLPSFYDTVWNQTTLPSRFNADFRSFEHLDPGGTPELGNVLHYASVADSVNGTKSTMAMNDDMMLELAHEYIFDDILVALCHLMQLEDKSRADEFFLNLPYTSLSLQLGAYFFALVSLYQEESSGKHLGDYLGMDRDKVVEMALSIEVTGENAKRSVALIEKFEGLRRDLSQAEMLQEQSGGSIDVGRFGHDEVYKKETILGMALCEDVETLRVALNLAKHYDVSQFDVLAGHLEHLFLANLPGAEIKGRLELDGLKDTLLGDKGRLKAILEERIGPLIYGSNYDHMALYYNLLLSCSETEDDRKRTQTCLALLESISTICKGVDIKHFSCGDVEEQKKALLELINEENVEDIAKLCRKYRSIFSQLSRSSVVQLFLKKEFIGSSNLPRGELKNIFKKNLKHIRFLSPQDLIDFIKGVCFNEDSARVLNRGYRLDILKSFLVFAKSMMSKQPKKPDCDDVCWADAFCRLNGYLQHLQKMEDGFIHEILDVQEDDRLEEYVHLFEMTAGEKEKLEAFLVNCALTECDTGLLQSLLSICPSNVINRPPVDFYLEAFQVALKQLAVESAQGGRSSKDTKDVPIVFQCRKPSAVIRRLLNVGAKASEDDGVFEAKIVELFRPFCLDKDLQMKDRLEILRLLKQTSSLSTDDESLLLHLETMALLQERWPNVSISQNEIEDEDKRTSVFLHLLEATSSWDQFETLCSLLSSWPPMQTRPSAWSQVLVQMSTSSCSSEQCLSVLRLANLQPDLPLEECQHVLNLWSSRFSSSDKVQFLLATCHEQLHQEAMQCLSEISPQNLSEAICDRILDVGLLSLSVATDHYSFIVDRLLSRDDYEELSKKAVQSLSSEGYHLEAASLLAVSKGLPRGLLSFTNVLTAFNNWK